MEKKTAWATTALLASALLAGAPGAAAAADPPCVVHLDMPDVRINKPSVFLWVDEHAACDRYHPDSTWLITRPDASTRTLHFSGMHWPQPAGITFDDSEGFGTYEATGAGTSDLTENVYTQQSMSFLVKRASGVALTAQRSGSHVTTGGLARAYSPAANQFTDWPAAMVRLESRPAAGGAWVTLSTYRTNAAGRIPTHRWYAPQVRQFRLVALGTPQIWPANGTPQRR
ncbi:hypothetical protein GCM10010124_32250 [Pilimelia terevasa]|uniref:Uncharacterized protein n=2 Tax=Pilimelia terevasa TaxID=53372 RepID=A0A8J3FL31_9ACTN|nr:hypothetical protein GCM10010124_32250 [Pilimelia terevasa]